MARPELPSTAVPYSVACSSISVGGSHPLFQPPAKNALLFFVWLWYIGLEIVKAALESSIFLFFLEQLCYFNLSPQGDGNTRLSATMMNLSGFQLIPARGRKPSSNFGFRGTSATISTYPRKGTETAFRTLITPVLANFNLSPQGDGNFDLDDFLTVAVTFQLIPARGRKHLLRTCLKDI